jgi:acyl-CoA thioesterase FadM
MHRLRVLGVVLKGLFIKNRRDDWKTPIRQTFWIFPWDVEVTRAYTHIYSSFMTLGRWAFCSYRIGMVKMIQKGWTPLTYSEHTCFKQSLKVFRKVVVETTLFHIDEKKIYFRHLFYSEGHLSAVGYSCGNLYKNRSFIPLTDIFKNIPEDLKVPTQEIQGWNLLDQEAKQFKS